MIKYSIYNNFFEFCKNFNVKPENIKKKKIPLVIQWDQEKMSAIFN